MTGTSILWPMDARRSRPSSRVSSSPTRWTSAEAIGQPPPPTVLGPRPRHPRQGRHRLLTGSVVGSLEAPVLNAVDFFILRDVFPTIAQRLSAAINTGILAQAAGMIAPGTTQLPPGIILSIRTVGISSAGVVVRAALGAYGGVFAKLRRPEVLEIDARCRCCRCSCFRPFDSARSGGLGIEYGKAVVSVD
jgi:hypothetical protein